MTTSTPNLSLLLYNASTDQAVNFATFRSDIAGSVSSSNFNKIDVAYGLMNTRLTNLEAAKGAVPVSAALISPNYYEATVASFPTSYGVGLSIILKLDTNSNGTVTLNINGLGTKSVMKTDRFGVPQNIGAGELQVGKYYLFMYDGTRWVWVSANSADQIYINGTAYNLIAVSPTGGMQDSGISVDTDNTLAANSDIRLPSQKAVKAYIDTIIDSANALVYKGVLDCSSNPNYPSANSGWMYLVSVAGKIGGASGLNVEVGDMLICKADSTPSGDHATVGASWSIVQKNIDGAVTNAGSATDKALAVFDGPSGKVIKDGPAPGAAGNALASDGNEWVSTPTNPIMVANTIHGADAKTSLTDADELGVSDSAESYGLKKITWANIKATFVGALGVLINALTAKTTPVGADAILVSDSESSNATKKLLLSNLYKALGTGTPDGTKALLGDGSWGTIQSGSSFWTLMLGTPVRVSNTSFTVTGDIASNSPIAKGTVIKWTESGVVKVGMISIAPTYSAPNSTITVIGDTMASIDANSLKYSLISPANIGFAIAGSVGATGTDVAGAWFAKEPCRVIGTEISAGMAGTSGNTTVDINKAGTTMFTTKPTLASGISVSTAPFAADNGISLGLNDKVTIDIDAIQASAAVDLYITLYTFPTRYLYLT